MYKFNCHYSASTPILPASPSFFFSGRPHHTNFGLQSFKQGLIIQTVNQIKVKKLIFLSLFFTSANSFAQGPLKSMLDRLQFGVKAGGNYSDFMNAGFGTEGLPGFHAGAIVGFKINDKLSIQEEFLFSQQGAKLKGDFQSPFIKSDACSVFE